MSPRDVLGPTLPFGRDAEVLPQRLSASQALLLQVQVLLGRGVRVDNLPLAYLCVLLVYDPFFHTFVILGHDFGFDRRRLRTLPGTILGRPGRKEGTGSEVRAHSPALRGP